MSKTKSCANCGKAFRKDARYSLAYWERQKYCSQSCAGKQHSAIMSSKRPDKKNAFEAHFIKSDGCWIWEWFKDKDGYGLFPYARRQHRAHVFALELDGRPVSKEKPFACHRCDNPSCVNPAHLYPGTHLDNIRDAESRGRIPRGESCYQAKLTEKDVRAIRLAQGTHDEIAESFGVSRTNVTLIRLRKTWKHIT